MASALVTALGGSDDSDSSAQRSPIDHYELKVVDNASGTPTLQVLAKRADGRGSKYQNLILYIDTPDSLRAFAASLPTLVKALQHIDDQQVKLKAWPARPAAQPAAQPTAPAEAPKKSAIASALDDLPW